jgi:hypothetical protein
VSNLDVQWVAKSEKLDLVEGSASSRAKNRGLDIVEWSAPSKMKEEPTNSVSIRAGNVGTLATWDGFAPIAGKRKMRKTFG